MQHKAQTQQLYTRLKTWKIVWAKRKEANLENDYKMSAIHKISIVSVLGTQ